MADTLIFAENGYTIWKEHGIGNDLIELLERTSWGNSELRYRHFLSEVHLMQIPDPHVFTLRIDGEILAAIVFCRRQVQFAGQTEQGFFIRFFAASPKIKGKGLVKLISKQVMDWVREEETQPTLYYAAVEAHNEASTRIVRGVGFGSPTVDRTLGFSRWRPQPKMEVEKLSDEGFVHFLPRLTEAFGSQHFWQTDNLNIGPGYWVAYHNGEPILGAQLHQGQWAVERLPGLGGQLLPLVRRLPGIKHWLNPDDFRFLAFEALYAHEKYVHLLPDFLETLLSQLGYRAAMGWFDSRDDRYATLAGSGQMGLLQSLTREAVIQLAVCPHHIPPAQEAAGRQGVCYVSSLDYI